MLCRTKLVMLLLLVLIPKTVHAQADMETPFEYETYTYLEDSLIFEHPAGWTIAAARNFREFVFVLNNLSRMVNFPACLYHGSTAAS